ncbi:hypothetical protein BJF83_20275 [Nocardiopsis sp. CNR-923]|nr:hypothetical protein BJF83_20275 [Nocardiopsis sp. CNR-923]
MSKVTAAWLEQDVPCEVVVAFTGQSTPTVARDVDTHRRVRVVRADADACAPGVLRNLGAEQARARVLYLSDADVVPIGGDFLARALRVADGRPLCQPWMYRLVEGPNAVASLRPGSSGADRDGLFCFATVEAGGFLSPVDGEDMLWQDRERRGRSTRTPSVVPPPSLVREPGDERRSRAPYHWGGLLLESTTFAQVGGYCTRYRGWGCEDDDLLVKLSAHGEVLRGWQTDPTWACAHVEHGYAHAGTAEHDANRAIYRERLASGPEAMIADDLAVFT